MAYIMSFSYKLPAFSFAPSFLFTVWTIIAEQGDDSKKFQFCKEQRTKRTGNKGKGDYTSFK